MRRVRRGTAAVSPAVHERFFDPADNSYANGEQPTMAFPLLSAWCRPTSATP